MRDFLTFPALTAAALALATITMTACVPMTPASLPDGTLSQRPEDYPPPDGYNPSVRHVLRGAPGDLIMTAQYEVNRFFFHGQPVELGPGTYTSAGTFWLFIVERVPGSCVVREGTLFRFHGAVDPMATFLFPVPIRASGQARASGDRAARLAYNNALVGWFDREVASRDSASYVNLTGAEIIDIFGYAECPTRSGPVVPIV